MGLMNDRNFCFWKPLNVYITWKMLSRQYVSLSEDSKEMSSASELQSRCVSWYLSKKIQFLRLEKSKAVNLVKMLVLGGPAFANSGQERVAGKERLVMILTNKH